MLPLLFMFALLAVSIGIALAAGSSHSPKLGHGEMEARNDPICDRASNDLPRTGR
mgnify:CR=1 FL=1